MHHMNLSSPTRSSSRRLLRKIAFSAMFILLIPLLMSISSTEPIQATSHTTPKSIVVNGDFEAGNTGFASDYTYQLNLVPEGTYYVTHNPRLTHPHFITMSDHTTGSGLMMVVNGSPDTNKVVWRGTINQDLEIGKSYDFSAWVANVTSAAPAKLTFKADGEVIGTLSPTGVGKWQRLSGTFTAKQARPILELQNAQSAKGGNDFAVDDINVFVPDTVEPPPPPPKKPGIHGQGDVHISSPDGLRYDFQEVGDFLAVQSTDGAVIFQARQAPWEQNDRVSVNKAVAIWVDGDKVEIYLQPKRTLQINDKVTDFPKDKLPLPKGGYIEPWGNNELYIYWPATDKDIPGSLGSFAARVIINSTFIDYGVARYERARTFEGFLTNMDGNPANDLQFRNSDEQLTAPPSVADLKRFGDSWRLSAEESLFDDAGPAGSPEPPMLIHEIDPKDREKAKKTCREGGVTEDTALRNCTYDVGITGDEEFVESAKKFEEAQKESPPPAVLPAQPGETLGGPIFDAAQANLAGISIKDGDDLIVTTGESADGKSYLRFHIYRNGEYVASFSVGVDKIIADAVAQGLVAKVRAELPAQEQKVIEEPQGGLDLDTLQLAIENCDAGLMVLQEHWYKYPEKADDWATGYQEFAENYLPSCETISEFISAHEEEVSAFLEQVGFSFRNYTASDGYGFESWDDVLNTITGAGSRIPQYCPGEHQIQFDCVKAPERIELAINAARDLFEPLYYQFGQ